MAWLVLAAAPAGAHARLVETSPTDDIVVTDEVVSRVELVFDEPMEITPDAIRVFGPDGDRVDASASSASEGALRVAADVEAGQRGTYTVAWRATSEDGHTLTGSFVFHVDVRTGAQSIDDGAPAFADAAGAVGRWLAFVGVLVALGAVAVGAMTSEASAHRRLRRLGLGAVAVGALGTSIVLLSQTAIGSGRELTAAASLLVEVGLGARTGRLLAWRIGLFLLAGGIFAASSAWPRVRWLPAVPLAGVALASTLGGHPWTASAPAAAVGAGVVHVNAAGVWAGGAVALLAVLSALSDRKVVVRRFSTAALVCTSILLVTGIVSALFQVPDLEALTSTGYGQLLLGKVAAFTAAVFVGWTNRRHVVHVVDTATSVLVRNLRLEVGLVAIILALTATLVDQPPARVSVAQPFDAIVQTAEASVQITVEPARVGDNTIHLYFYDSEGSTPLTVDAVEVTASQGSIPPRRLAVLPAGPNHVSAYGATLGAPGTWTIAIVAVRGGSPITFEVEVPIR